jgi:biotin carboxylase
VAEALSLPFHSVETAQALTDKFVQRRRLADEAVPSARSVVLSGPGDLEPGLAVTGLPAIAKPRSGSGSVATVQVDDAENAREVVGEIFSRDPTRQLVLEELLVGDPSAAGAEWGDHVSVESVASDGRIRTLCVTGKLPLVPPFRESGQFVPSTLDADLEAEVVETAVAALRALNVRWGVTHTELKLTASGPRVIEVNGRLGGYLNPLLRRAGGVDMVSMALATALGDDVTVTTPQWRGVEFVYLIVPPVTACVLTAWNAEVRPRDVPGVRNITLRGTPGQRVDWTDGTQGHVGIVTGSCAGHDDVQLALRAFSSALDAEWEHS